MRCKKCGFKTVNLWLVNNGRCSNCGCKFGKSITMHDMYGEPDDEIGKHLACYDCGHCIECGDCVCNTEEVGDEKENKR